MQADKMIIVPKVAKTAVGRLHDYCAIAMACTLLILASNSVLAQDIQVLSWWKSASEHKAVEVLSTRLRQENIVWHDVVIPSGGMEVSVALKNRVLAGSAPDIAQLKGPLIGEWFAQGLLSEFKPIPTTPKDIGNLTGKWDKQLFPTVGELVRPNGHLVAVPLGIHRMNTLFYNRRVFDQLGLRTPETWEDFNQAANKLLQKGIVPLAQSSEPWQVASLFETLVLSESSPEFYRRAFVKKDPSAFTDIRFGRALMRLRMLKKMMPHPLKEISWMDAAKMVTKGDAGMVMMGDFAKGEMNASGLTTDVDFACAAAPNTSNYHLYSVDTLVMLTNSALRPEVADKIAQIAISTTVQTDYNVIKGSISVLRNADQIRMDSCARNSWKVFSRGSTAQAPSLVNDMATDSLSKDAILAEVVQFFNKDALSIADTQRRLATIMRSLPKNKSGKMR